MNHVKKETAGLSGIDAILNSYKVLICVGSGGVGKTTLSAALGVRAAQLGLRVLVMTIDPSKRLKVALGLDEKSSTSKRVVGQNYKGELSAILLNAEEIFKEFITGSSANSELAQRLLKNKLYQQLSTTLSGSQEFTSLLQLTKIVNEAHYDLVILDTPPAQHAVDFLEAPAKIRALFQESVIRWFVGDEGGGGFVRKIISRGTLTVLKAFEKITGSLFMSELNDFFRSVRALQSHIGERTERVGQILNQSTTGFFLVTAFDHAKLREADVLNAYLDSKGYHLTAALINRAFPRWRDQAYHSRDERLNELYKQWCLYQAERERIFNEFSEKWRQKLPVARIPDLNNDIQGLQGLEAVAHEVALAFSDIHANQLQSG